MSSSIDHVEGRFGKLCRLGWRALLGFDFLHVWRNRKAALAADVIWTHTESQHLGVSLLFLLLRRDRSKRPKLLAQSVWLFDKWPRFSAPRRAFYRLLMRQADVLTVHSPENLAVVETAMPGARCELALFGIKSETFELNRSGRSTPLNIIAIGNDVHRHWALAVQAVARQPEWTLSIVSRNCPASLTAQAPNVRVLQIGNNTDLFALYRSADLLIMPLKTNRHASGITVLQEAALMGVPSIATDTGGLRAYFADDEILYVPPDDAEALEAAIAKLAADDHLRAAMARKAQGRMGPDTLSSVAFVRRHIELSHSMLGTAAAPVA